MMDEYEVTSTVVKRIVVRHRVFAPSKALALDLVLLGKGQRVDRDTKRVEGPKHTVKRIATKED